MLSFCVTDNPQQLVVKPDQLIKRRGKLGLIKVNVDLQGCRAWLAENLDKEIKVQYLNYLLELKPIAFFVAIVICSHC